MKKLHYVLLLAMDSGSGQVVGSIKLKGPAFLLNKITFPGGKVAENETILNAASREMEEETAVKVRLLDWVPVSCYVETDYVLNVRATDCKQALHARTKEYGPVFLLDIEFHLNNCSRQPDAYAPDFETHLKNALSALKLT